MSSLADLPTEPCAAIDLVAATAAWSTPWQGRELLTRRFRIERRDRSRHPVDGTATILGLGAELGRMIELTRLDTAPWWLGGDALEPVAVGIRVSVGFSRPDARPASAVVRRCDRLPGGLHRIALEFDGAAVLAS